MSKPLRTWPFPISLTMYALQVGGSFLVDTPLLKSPYGSVKMVVYFLISLI
jgi:hypothetical protein